MRADRGELKKLIDRAFEIFSKEPQLIRREEGEFLVVGDTHGDLETTLNAIKIAEEESLECLGGITNPPR